MGVPIEQAPVGYKGPKHGFAGSFGEGNGACGFALSPT